MLRRATALKRICDRQRVQNAASYGNYICSYRAWATMADK